MNILRYTFLFLFVSTSLFAEVSVVRSTRPPYTATHFLLVRHGETYRNAQGKEIQGWIDDDAAQLNEKGKVQADELGKLIYKHYQYVLTAIYTSPLGRSLETAEHIAKYFEGIPIIQDRRFMEICHGQHDTMSYRERNEFCLQRYAELENEFKNEYPNQKLGCFFKWAMNPLEEREIPAERREKPFEGEVETVLQLFERAREGLEEIAKKHPGKTVLICTHAALIKTLLDEIEYREKGVESPLPVYYEPTSRHLPANCSIYHLKLDNGKLTLISAD